MARYLPLFPLNLVVYPGEKLNLHIFEPRYKQLINDCFASDATFGIPAFIQNKVCTLGTEVKIISIEKTYPNGEMDIKTRGLGIIKVLDFFKQAPNKFYPAGTVEDVNIIQDGEEKLKFKITGLLQQLHSILGIQKLFIDLPDTYKIYDIAHHIGLSIEKEYELLAAESEYERQLLVLEHLEQIMPIVTQTEKLKERVKMNGHFKNIKPPSF